MEKRGQFYIVAAVIIVLAVSGLASVTTYAIVNQSPRTIEDLSSDLEKESIRVVDFGIYSGVEKVEDFISDKFAPYFLKKTENANVVFIYGDKTDLHAVEYKEDISGIVSLSIGDGELDWTGLGIYAKKTPVSVLGNLISVEILDNIYKFELRDNEMFYFVIVQEKEDERYVKRN